MCPETVRRNPVHPDGPAFKHRALRAIQHRMERIVLSAQRLLSTGAHPTARLIPQFQRDSLTDSFERQGDEGSGMFVGFLRAY
jgi:hypothetical protein